MRDHGRIMEEAKSKIKDNSREKTPPQKAKGIQS